MGSPHVAVVAFPFSSHAPKLLAVARALATAAPSATFSFLSTSGSLERLLRGAVVSWNLRFVCWSSPIAAANGEQSSAGGVDGELTPPAIPGQELDAQPTHFVSL